MIYVVCLGGILLIALSVGFIGPLQKRVFQVFRKTISPYQREKYSQLATWNSLEEEELKDFKKRVKLIGGILGICFILSTYLYMTAGGGERLDSLSRPGFGSGDEQYKLVAQIKGQQVTFTVTANEQEPDSEEMKAFFDRVAEELFAIALDENEGADYITKDMNLVEQTSSGAEVSWKLSSLDYMNSFGKLREDIPEDGEEIILTATISYGKYSLNYDLKIKVYPQQKTITEEESLIAEIESAIVEREKELVLPKDIEITSPRENSYQYVAIISVFGGIILWIVLGEELDNRYKKRQMELISDYSKIISELSILLASGLSVTEAWTRMGNEYEKRRGKGEGASAGYEELLLSVYNLKNTKQIEKVFSDFAGRCGERHYRQLSALLIQNIKKGSIHVSLQLKKEADAAFELRKEIAREKGERAQAKLMIPTFMLFALVLALVIYPAWSGL